jgi:hypothetical protein
MRVVIPVMMTTMRPVAMMTTTRAVVPVMMTTMGAAKTTLE